MKRIEKLYKLKKHSGNPRIIKDVKFKKLVESLKEFPEMMEQRPLIVNRWQYEIKCSKRIWIKRNMD
jgi:uncharacterized Fe-S cluster-containing radical SAM superfamily enzyme